MNINQLEKQIEDARQSIESAQAEIEKLKTKELWKPEKGRGYYYVDSDGEIVSTLNNGTHFDRWLISQGNCFKTRQEAEKHRDKLVLIAELKEFAGYWKPDWSDWGQYKYRLIYLGDLKRWLVRCNTSSQMLGQIHFKTRERAQEAIEHFGDRLNLLLED